MGRLARLLRLERLPSECEEKLEQLKSLVNNKTQVDRVLLHTTLQTVVKIEKEVEDIKAAVEWLKENAHD